MKPVGKKLRVLALMHEDLVPPDTLNGHSEKEIQEWKTEYDVVSNLKKMGHEVRSLGVLADLGKIREAIEEFKPHIAFNLLEEFHGVSVYDQHVVSYLELMKQPYTGCNPRGLMLSHDKALCKQILSYHRIPSPRFVVFQRGRKVHEPKRLKYPLLVKSATEEASLGISQASVVHCRDKLKDRVEFIYENVKSDALVEEYIEGRELYVGILGNQRLKMLPIWELHFTKTDDVPLIATAKVKWDAKYQKKIGVETRAATDLPAGAEQNIHKLCHRTYKALYLTGCARIDLRLSAEGQPFVLEANPNPNLAHGEDFADSAQKAGIKYRDLLRRIMGLGFSYKAAWQANE